MPRPPRTISREDERRERCERDQRWFAGLGISEIEVKMLMRIIRRVRDYRPYVSNEGPTVSRHLTRGALNAIADARNVIISELLDRVDGCRIETYEVMEAQPDFAPGLTRSARMDRLFYAMAAVDELDDSA